MIETTPFHPRVAALNRTHLWSHWAGRLVAEKYHMSEKLEYFAVRNAVGVFDTSPLYKYRITGADAESYLAGLLARDIRTCRVGQAQYQIWCDDRGYVLEDGVVFRLGPADYLMTTARPNLALLRSLSAGASVVITDVGDDFGAIAVQGPRSRSVLGALAPETEALGFFELIESEIAGVPVIISRTGYTGDLGYEVWVPADRALAVWDAVFEAGRPHGLLPFGQIALLMARIEAGLLLIDVDFQSSHLAFNDAQRSTPFELGLGWMLAGLEESDRPPFVGREALRHHRRESTARWRSVGLAVDPVAFAAAHEAAGLIPPMDHRPDHTEAMVYDQAGSRVGFLTSSMYSPMAQRRIALARLRPEVARTGTPVKVEFTIDHRYEMIDARVTSLPFFDPERKTA